MLLNLHVEHYALIDQLDLNFQSGLSVITGETGAGKSILLGALGLLLGQRADTKVIQDGKSKCISEATFDIANDDLESYFTDHDLEYDSNLCTIRRELHQNGKSRAFVNDSPVSLTQLKDLSGKLLDIHSQHQNLLLGTDGFQLSVVDALAKNTELLLAYQKTFTEAGHLKAALKKQKDAQKRLLEEESFLRFQYDQLYQADLKADEEVDLDAELQKLTHAEEIKTGIGRMVDLLDQENGIVNNLKSTLGLAENVQKYISTFHDIQERLKLSYVDLKDLIRDLETMFEDVEVNPNRLNQVTERLNLLYTLHQKHKVNSNQELIELRESLNTRLQMIENGGEDTEKMEKALFEAEQNCQNLANNLSKSRQAVFSLLETSLTEMISNLGMPRSVFKINHTHKALDINGQDFIEFTFSASGKGQLRPIQDIASGGEISRIMLCIKSILAECLSLPTLFFDEIDTGISGEIAHKMGQIMRKMSNNRQIICITHLPQIAALGQYHFKVMKNDHAERTQTNVVELTYKERMNEIAGMLSGANLTEAAIINAQQLLQENP